LEDGGHLHASAKEPGEAALPLKSPRSDALPENTILEDGGHLHASAEGRGQAVLPLKRPRSDALPENTHYVDTGCAVHPSCLTCPLVRCRYDEPGGARRLLSEGRDRSIVQLRRAGVGFEEIARRCGVSRRTVFRALARNRGPRGVTSNHGGRE
jgi:hypothetical protein